jgi:hypothetical protein
VIAGSMSGDAPGTPGGRGVLGLLLLFLAAAVFHTWPLASALGGLSRHDNADALLNEWVLAWVAHQLPRNPLGLFNANIFHPEANTLAFSEHLFVQGSLGLPLRVAGLSTTVVHNLLVLAGFALTGWTMALVVRRWTGDWWAAILGGLLLAFNAHSLSRLAHVQALHVQFLPLALYALDRLLVRPGVVRAIGLSLACVLQSLTSNYWLVFMAFGLPGAALMRVRDWLWPGRRRTLGLLALSAALAIILLTPFLYPYYLAREEQGLRRPLEEVATYAAVWTDYLAASGRLHYGTWSVRYARGEGAFLFPGVVALVLTGVAIASGRLHSRTAQLWTGLGLTGLVLSFGTRLPFYEYLYAWMPLLQGVRASVRFGSLVLAAVAALAAFGLADLRRRLSPRPRLRLAVSAAALILVTAEAARLPLVYAAPWRVHPIYAALADEPAAVLVELPLYPPVDALRNAPYLLNSTAHWRPIVNGYSGLVPRDYPAHWEALREFPEASAVAYLRSLGVTHVAINRQALADLHGEERLQRVLHSPALAIVGQGGTVALYRLRN